MSQRPAQMDPLASISRASGILDVIRSGADLVAAVSEIHQSTSGLTAKNHNLELDCLQLNRKAEDLRQFAKEHIESFPSGEDGKELIRISEKCVSATCDILRSLDQVRAKHKKIQDEPALRGGDPQVFMPGQKAEDFQRRRLNVLRQAIKAVWKKDETKRFSKILSDLRAELELHILSVLQKEQARSSALDDYRFEALQQSNKDLIHQIIRDRDIFLEQVTSRVDNLHQDTKSSLLDAISKVNKHIPSCREIEAAASRMLLTSLHFSSIHQRYEEVTEAHRSTFEWIFETGNEYEPEYISFPRWLQSGAGIYWLNGKAASGKSTLMRYIVDNMKVYELLCRWAPDHELDVFTFFFWNSGTVEQRSLLGILRSVLCQYLSKHQEQIKFILPLQYDLFYKQQPLKSDQPIIKWSAKTLREAFRKMIEFSASRRICLFIDGLDEYEGDHTEMARFLMKIANHEHVKICVSSRPWLQFEKIFQSCPSMRLQDLTKIDISIYVESRLGESDRWLSLREEQPDEANKIINHIVNIASGVFLWVKLILNSLIKGLDLDDDFEDLSQRLRCLPRGLEELYSHMLKTIDPPFYLEEASMFFEVLRTAKGGQEVATIDAGDDEWSGGVISLGVLALTDRKNFKQLEKMNFAEPRSSFMMSLCQKTESRLKSRCMGLLEVNENEYKSLENHTVSYIHRTFRDFLERPSIRLMIQESIKDESFTPNLSLIQSCVFYLQLTLPETITIPSLGVLKLLQLSIIYASNIEENHANRLRILLDKMDSIMMNHQKKYDNSNYHWTTEKSFHKQNLNIVREDDTFLSFCVENLVFCYVRSTLQHSPSLVRKESGRPLLDYAVSSLLNDPGNVKRAQMCKLLLEQGALPNQAYCAVSPWAEVLSYLGSPFGEFDDLLAYQKNVWSHLIGVFLACGASKTISVFELTSGIYTSVKSILADRFAREFQPHFVGLERPPRQEVYENAMDSQSTIMDPQSSEIGAISTAIQSSNMQQGWAELEQVHSMARCEIVYESGYGTFHRAEAEIRTQSFSVWEVLKNILCCS